MKLGIQRAMIRHLAARYRLRNGKGGEPDDRPAFDDTWTIYKTLVAGLAHAESCRWQSVGETAVKQAPGWIRELVAQAEAGEDRPSTTAPGFERAIVLPTRGRYVVFSDHHITPADHHQAFFTHHNVDLYAAAMRSYGEAGYTVVENGDVEELIILDRDLDRGVLGSRRAHVEGADNPDKTLPPRFLDQRVEDRLEMLDRILSDDGLRPWLDASRALDADRRLLRVAGNHDYDLQRPEFLARLRQELPNQEHVWDVVLLRHDDGRVSHCILHGHQFDRATNPTTAPRFGETISESLAMWYQGADRVWLWDTDGPRQWVGSTYDFNRLVEDKVSWDGKRCSDIIDDGGLEAMGATGDDLEEITQAEAARALAELDPDTREALDALLDDILADIDEADLAPGGPLEGMGPDTPTPPRDKLLHRIFESLFKHNVAWEYFDRNNALAAVVREVFTGERFFKFRHTDEFEVREALITHFPDPARRPTLVLGHSHEPRLNALDKQGRPFRHYLNSAATGRFERMAWAVELVDGEPTLVTWTFAPDGVTPERREWRNGDGARLIAGRPTPLTPLEVT